MTPWRGQNDPFWDPPFEPPDQKGHPQTVWIRGSGHPQPKGSKRGSQKGSKTTPKQAKTGPQVDPQMTGSGLGGLRLSEDPAWDPPETPKKGVQMTPPDPPLGGPK
jgi:hypothetical protein